MTHDHEKSDSAIVATKPTNARATTDINRWLNKALPAAISVQNPRRE